MDETNTFLPKWLSASLGVLLLIFLGILIIQKGNDLNNSLQNKKPANTISVSAEGKVSAIPDLAAVTVGVMSQGKDASEVQSKNNEKINKIIDFVKSQGVSKEDIVTSQYYAYPQQDWKDGTMSIIGYQANQTITVKVRDVDKDQSKLEAVLKGAVDNGANEIQGVNMTFEDADNFRQEARKQAIAKAKQKASELADEAGLKLGKVVSVSESGGYYPPMPYASDAAFGVGGSSAQMKSIAPNIEPGSQEITQTMTVVFEVK